MKNYAKKTVKLSRSTRYCTQSILSFESSENKVITVNRVLVSDIMTRQIATADPDTSLLECARRMVRKKIGSLIIVNGKKLAGFISVQDILWAIIKKSKEDLSKIKASEISPEN